MSEKATRSSCLRLATTLAMVVGLAILLGGCSGVPKTLGQLKANRFTLIGAADANEAELASLPMDDALTFGTYNVNWFKNEAQLRADLGRLREVDAWAFQEVRGPADVVTLPLAVERILPSGIWYGVYVPVNRLAELGSDDVEAQVIVSRFPIRESAIWELDRVGDKRRVAVAATLITPAGDILFVNTDHEPGFFSPGFGNRRQVASLSGYLEKSDAQNVVVAGDFNSVGNLFRLTGNRGEVEHLRSALKVAGLHALGEADNQSASQSRDTFHEGAYRARLDQFFIRGLICTIWQTDSSARGSDHYPVWCRLRAAAKPGV